MRIITKIFSVILLVTLLTCTVSAADKINWYFKKTLDHSQPKLDSYLAEAGKHKNLIWIDKENDRFDSDTKRIYITFDAHPHTAGGFLFCAFRTQLAKAIILKTSSIIIIGEVF